VVDGDEDLRWFAAAARTAGPGPAVRFAKELREDAGQTRKGPVAAYLAGALARWGGRRHLAKLWLAQALEGHGDACRAAALYAGVLAELGRDPHKDEGLRKAVERQRCASGGRGQ
jgi:hypothetical protein